MGNGFLTTLIIAIVLIVIVIISTKLHDRYKKKDLSWIKMKVYMIILGILFLKHIDLLEKYWCLLLYLEYF